MNVTLHRKGDVKSFEAIMTIESMSTERQDIVELLQYIRDNGGKGQEAILKPILGESVPDFVVNGVIEHLKAIGLLYPNGFLSSTGLKVSETGQVPIEERGQFIVFYLEDALINNYLLHYQRNGKGKLIETATCIDSNLYTNKTFTSVIDSQLFKIKQFDGNVHLGYVTESSGTYHLYWDIDLNRTEISMVRLSGELISGTSKVLTYYYEFEELKKLDYKRLLHLIIDKNKAPGMNWNQEAECLEVPLGDLPIQDYENLQTSLKVRDLNFKFGKFDATEIHSIPIGPKNEIDAKKWLMLLLKKFLEEGYKNKVELISYLEQLKEHKAFLNYKYIIDSLTIEEILAELKAINSPSYWNLQTPLDLFMDVDDRFIVRNRRLDVALGTKLSMMDIIDWVIDNDQPDVLVFYSKYVEKFSQIKKFELFVAAFKNKGVRDILLVTKTNNSNILTDNNVQVEPYDELFEGTIPPHDRYFAYKSSGRWHFFKMTAELDQCRYNRLSEADEHTKGEWQDISFLEITPEIFPEKLSERLAWMTEVNYI